jgi:hypothetical protein
MTTTFTKEEIADELRKSDTMRMRDAEIRRLERKLATFDATKAATPAPASDAETDRLLRLTPEGRAIADARMRDAEAALLHAHDRATWAAHKVWDNHDLSEKRRRELLGQTEAGRAFLANIDEKDRATARALTDAGRHGTLRSK